MKRNRTRQSYCYLVPLIALMAIVARPLEMHGEDTFYESLLREGTVIAPSQVKPGMKGVCRSVFRGTQIETFAVEALGVLEKINSGGDVVLIRILDGPVVERNAGIIAGMSGSPVYLEGKLLGALAFGWTFAREPLAGVTPVGDMLYSLSDAPPSAPHQAADTGKAVRLAQPLSIDGRNYVSAVISYRGKDRNAPAEKGTICLEPVDRLLLVSGFRPSSLPRLTKIFEPYHFVPVIGAGTSARKIDAPLEPGAAITAQLVRGDLDVSAVGTLTFKLGDRILAFGHPFLGVGDLSVPLTNAWVHDIFPSQYMSFKLASPGQTVGAITQDWAWAIGGRLAQEAPMVPVTIRVADNERNLVRTCRVEVASQKDIMPVLILNSAIEATYAAYGMQTEDTVKIELTIESDGMPTVRRENVYYNDGYAVIAAVTELAQALSVLTQNDFERAKIKRVELRCELERARRSAKIKRIFTNRSKVKPGEEIEVGIAIEPHGQPLVSKTTKFTIPKDTPGGLMWIGAGSGMSELMLRSRLGLHIPIPTNLRELLALYEQLQSNSNLIVKAALPRFGVSVSGKDLSVLPASVFQVMRASRSTDVKPVREHIAQMIPTDWMITGSQLLSVRIDSKKKAPVISEPPGRPQGPEESEPTPPGDQPPPPTPTAQFLSQSPDDLACLPRAELLTFLDFLEECQHSRVGRSENPNPPKPPDTGAGKKEDKDKQDEDEDEEEEETAPATSPGTSPPAETSPSPPTPRETSKSLARQPKTWKRTTVQDFLSGTMTNVAATTKGDIRLAPESKLLFRSEELYLWSVTADASGNAYVGTGNEGKIFKITPDGKTELLYDSPQVAITQLLFASNGSFPLFASGAPEGVIHRIDATGTATVFARLPVPFIWSMVFDDTGYLYAATGPRGQIFRVRPDGVAQVLVTLPQDHVRTLILGPDKTVYAGTGDTGVVYRVSPTLEVQALYTAGNGEITCLALDKSGNLYFGTAGKAGVYRIDSSGMVKTIYEPQVQAVYHLVADDGNLYVATGDPQKQGIVYRMNIEGDESVNRILEADEGQVLGLHLTQDGRLLACTGNGASLYDLKLPFSRTGMFESDVLDAKVLANWGQIRWHATLPEGTNLSVEARSGNTREPDESWSAWSAPLTEATGSPLPCPPARFVQYRCHLSGTQTASPILEGIEVTYLTKNQPPTVSLKNIRGGEHWSGEQTVEWTGKDPDNDPLTYEMLTSDDNGKTWKPVKLKSPQASMSPLNTRDLKDGIYRIKIIASDISANPADGLTAEAISKPIVIDNTPPTLLFKQSGLLRQEDQRVAGNLIALDTISAITSAEYRVDEGEWKAATASDGIFDSGWEDIQFLTHPLNANEHTVEVRVRDSAGNVVAKKEKLAGSDKPESQTKKPDKGKTKSTDAKKQASSPPPKT